MRLQVSVAVAGGASWRFTGHQSHQPSVPGAVSRAVRRASRPISTRCWLSGRKSRQSSVPCASSGPVAETCTRRSCPDGIKVPLAVATCPEPFAGCRSHCRDVATASRYAIGSPARLRRLRVTRDGGLSAASDGLPAERTRFMPTPSTEGLR